MQHSVCNFTLCILRRVSKFLAESFDILLMGDMFFDENLGGKLSNLARTFKETCPKSKMVLIGDPGRWLLSEQKNRVFQNTLIWKVQAFLSHSWFSIFGFLTSFGALWSCKTLDYKDLSMLKVIVLYFCQIHMPKNDKRLFNYRTG